MYLSPLVGQRLEVARCLSFQSYGQCPRTQLSVYFSCCPACSFILAHGFNMQTMFREGVPYLSRPDAVKAKARAFERYSWKNDMPGIALGVDDTALLAFVEQSREKIREWGRWTVSLCLWSLSSQGKCSILLIRNTPKSCSLLMTRSWLLELRAPNSAELRRASCIS